MRVELTEAHWTRSRVLELLESNDKAVERALLIIHARQTAEERTSKVTKEENNRGFSGPDAFLLSRFSEDLQKYQSLTPNKVKIARTRLKKYWRQLLEEIASHGRPVHYNPKY